MTTIAAYGSERMFFLLGRGRSGTTLLRTILNANPCVSVPPEGMFILYLRGLFPVEQLSKADSRRFAELLFQEQRMRRWNIDQASIANRFDAIAAPRSFAAHCEAVYEAHADSTGKRAKCALGDKNPHYAIFAEELAERFPNARFIHLVRDYRDNVLSYRGVKFDLSELGALAHRWVLYNRSILRAAQRYPNRFYRIHFEELLAKPRQSIESLCVFLDVPFAEKMLDTEAREKNPQPWHANLEQPISNEIAGQWRRSMPLELVEMIDAICQPLGRELGYTPLTEAAALSLRARYGIALGAAYTALERLLFTLPLAMRVLVIDTYRRWTGNRIE
ncbi:MAG: sulfotransferase family protein [Thermoanaerobaculia bacterium]